MDCQAPAPPKRAGRSVSWAPFLVLLAGYLTLHFVLRLTGSASLEFDEAEQFILVQSPAQGYNTQPPLLTWCFWGLSQVFGESLATLTLLRLGCLGLTYFFLYASARFVLRDGTRALLVASSLLLIPALGWEAVADRTHTTLLCALCLATVVAMLQVLHDGRRRWFFALGMCLGCGILCKYNYALFAAALLLATLTMPAYRNRLCTRRLVWMAVAVVPIVVPHLFWLAGHYEELLALVRAKALVGDSGPVMSRLRGLAMIGSNLVQIVGALLAILIGCFPQVCRPTTWTGGDVRRWLDRFLVASVLLLGAVVLVEGMAHIRLYWMLPFLTVVPLMFFVRIENAELGRWPVLGFGAIVAASVLAVAVVRVHQARYHAPRDAMYAALADQLQADGFRGGIVWAQSHQEGGNLRHYLPGARVFCWEYPLLAPPEVADRRPRLLLWDATLFDGVSHHLRRWGKDRGITFPRDPALVRYVSASAAESGSRGRLGYLLLPETSP